MNEAQCRKMMARKCGCFRDCATPALFSLSPAERQRAVDHSESKINEFVSASKWELALRMALDREMIITTGECDCCDLTRHWAIFKGHK
jgi:hypothetical protein